VDACGVSVELQRDGVLRYRLGRIGIGSDVPERVMSIGAGRVERQSELGVCARSRGAGSHRGGVEEEGGEGLERRYQVAAFSGRERAQRRSAGTVDDQVVLARRAQEVPFSAAR
jgi:hypothetical protein